jgi:hypothetical protein
MSTSAVSAIYTTTTISAIIAAIFTVSTATASSVSASNRRPHLVNPFGTWTYYLKVPRL